MDIKPITLYCVTMESGAVFYLRTEAAVLKKLSSLESDEYVIVEKITAKEYFNRVGTGTIWDPNFSLSAFAY